MTDNSPPAFPASGTERTLWGLSQRDYFAAMALQGSLAAETENTAFSSHAKAAAYAFDLADAMIAEQKKRQES